jgi:hypothetical protein
MSRCYCQSRKDRDSLFLGPAPSIPTSCFVAVDRREGAPPRRTSLSLGARCRDMRCSSIRRRHRPGQTRPTPNRLTAPLWEVCGVAKSLLLSLRRKSAWDLSGDLAVGHSSDAVNALLIFGRNATAKRSAVINQTVYVFYVLYRTEATPRHRCDHGGALHISLEFMTHPSPRQTK